MKKPSMFATGRARDGRSLQWEGTAYAAHPVNVSAAFPNLTFLINAPPIFNVQCSQVVVPINETRGQVTLERVRGWSQFWREQSTLEPTGGNPYWPSPLNLVAGASVHTLVESLQLVPAQQGALVTTTTTVVGQLNNAFLSVTEPDNQDQSRIIWQRWHRLELGASVDDDSAIWRYMPQGEAADVDIKSKRRWDRSTWALVHTVEMRANSATQLQLLTFWSGHFRCLFRSYDGL